MLKLISWPYVNAYLTKIYTATGTKMSLQCRAGKKS